MNTTDLPATRPPVPQHSRLTRLLRRRSVQAAILSAAVFVMAAAVSNYVFEAMPHIEDEHANYFQAQVFARGEIVAARPPHPNSFFIPFVVMFDGNWFSKYTPGYSLALALGVLLGAPWTVNALAAALGVFGVFLLGRDLFDEDAGLLAASLGAAAPAPVILSGSLLPHPLTLAALVYFAWGFVRARRPGEGRAGRFALLAGAALGLAAITRPWTALGIAAPFGLLAAFDLASDFRRSFRIYAPMAVACAAVCSLLLIYNYAATGYPFSNTYTFWWPYDTVGFGRTFGRQGGHTLRLAFLNAGLDLSAFRTAAMGWPAPFGLPLMLLPIGLALLLPPRKGWDWALLVPPACLIAAHLAYWARAGDYYGGRYYSEGMPFLWLAAARGLQKFSGGRWRLRAVRAALPAILAWSILFQILPRFDYGRGLYNITRRDADLIASSGVHHALIFVDTVYWTDYANLSWLNSPDLDGDIIYARDLGYNANRALLLAFPGRDAYIYDRNRPEDPLVPYEP